MLILPSFLSISQLTSVRTSALWENHRTRGAESLSFTHYRVNASKIVMYSRLWDSTHLWSNVHPRHTILTQAPVSLLLLLLWQNTWPNQLRGSSCLADVSRSQSVSEGSQGKNLEQKSWGTLQAHSRAQSQAQAGLSNIAQKQLPGMVPSTVSWAPTKCPHTNLIWAIPQSMFSPQIILVCVNWTVSAD